MPSAKQIAWRKKFARMSKAGKFKKKQSQSKSAKNPKSIGAKKTSSGKTPISYHSETKKKAEENRRYYEKMDGVKIKPPVQTKGKVPHHNNNYWYWTIYRPVTW